MQKASAAPQVVEKLAAHPGSNVRAVASDAAGTLFITGSFDKSVKMYTGAAGGSAPGEGPH